MLSFSACIFKPHPYSVTSQLYKNPDSSFKGTASENRLCASLCGLSFSTLSQYLYHDQLHKYKTENMTSYNYELDINSEL